MTTSLHEPAAAEVGRLLREARLACGKELAVAAEELRIRPTHLEALEEGRLGRLLAPVYVVGQTRAYAKHLGLDGAELARRLKMPGGRGGAPGVERSEPAVGRWRAAASLAGLLLLGVGAYVGCRAGFRTGPGTMPAPSSSAAPTSTPVAPVADPGGPTASLPDGPREAAASPTSPVTAAEARPEPQRAPIADLSPSPAQSTLAGAAAAPAPGGRDDGRPAPVQATNAPPHRRHLRPGMTTLGRAGRRRRPKRRPRASRARLSAGGHGNCRAGRHGGIGERDAGPGVPRCARGHGAASRGGGPGPARDGSRPGRLGARPGRGDGRVATPGAAAPEPGRARAAAGEGGRDTRQGQVLPRARRGVRDPGRGAGGVRPAAGRGQRLQAGPALSPAGRMLGRGLGARIGPGGVGGAGSGRGAAPPTIPGPLPCRSRPTPLVVTASRGSGTG